MQTIELGQFISLQVQDRIHDKLTQHQLLVSVEGNSKDQIVSSSTEDKKNECVRSSLTKPKKNDKSKHTNTKSKQLKSVVGSQKLTQQSLEKINKLYFLQKINRIKEWVSSKNDASHYPYPFLL